MNNKTSIVDRRVRWVLLCNDRIEVLKLWRYAIQDAYESNVWIQAHSAYTITTTAMRKHAHELAHVCRDHGRECLMRNPTVLDNGCVDSIFCWLWCAHRNLMASIQSLFLVCFGSSSTDHGTVAKSKRQETKTTTTKNHTHRQQDTQHKRLYVWFLRCLFTNWNCSVVGRYGKHYFASYYAFFASSSSSFSLTYTHIGLWKRERENSGSDERVHTVKVY